MTESRAPNKAPLVALLSDFGSGSFYVGVMKAAVCHAAPSARIVDITHDISPHAVDEGSFILSTVFEYAPQGTIFLAVVDPGVGGDRRNLAFHLGDRYLVAPDNGLVTDLATRYDVRACFSIIEESIESFRCHPRTGRTFYGRDLFAPAAGAIAMGTPLEDLGQPVDAFDTFEVPSVREGTDRIEGCGRYVDQFGNVLTNITKDHLARVFPGRPLDQIRVRAGNRMIEGIRECYVESPRDTLLAVLDSWNLIEVAVNHGRAAEILSVSDPRKMRIVLEI